MGRSKEDKAMRIMHTSIMDFQHTLLNFIHLMMETIIWASTMLAIQKRPQEKDPRSLVLAMSVDGRKLNAMRRERIPVRSAPIVNALIIAVHSRDSP